MSRSHPLLRLIPSEHGAWVQLAAPALVVLLAGRPGGAAGLLALAALALFLCHEAALVVVGARGPRARERAGPAAPWVLGVLGGVAVIAGGWGIGLAGEGVTVALLAPIVPAAMVAPLAVRRRERSTPGEILVALSLAGLALPLGLASGLPAPTAAAHQVIWSLLFVSQTLSARGVLAMAKKRDPRPHLLWIGVGVIGLAVVAAGVMAEVDAVDGPAPALALFPALALALLVARRPPSAKRLMAVGFAFLAVDLLVAGALLVAA